MSTAFQILEAAQRVCARNNWRSVGNRLNGVQSAPHYCESGYSTNHPVILFGNWNCPVQKDSDYSCRPVKHSYKTPSDEAQAEFFAGVCKALESCAELEWSDEWTTCSECGGALRTSGDSYGWQRGFVELDGEILCADCARKDASRIVESFENEDNKCLTADLGFDLSALGYVKLEQDFENGFYGGQDADPRKIAKALRARDISRFVFLLDSVGQFDMNFSVWVHSDESEKMPAELSHNESAADLDPAEGLKHALQNIPPVSGEGITYVQCDPSTGKSTARKVCPQEFIDGKMGGAK